MPQDCPAPPIRVLVVDSTHAVRAGVGALLASAAPHVRPVGQADDRHSALVLAAATRPHVVVLDADLAGEDGLALIPALRCTGAAVVILTSLPEAHLKARACALGASAFIAKHAPAQALLDAIRHAAHP